jgi:hypothetical protein
MYFKLSQKLFQNPMPAFSAIIASAGAPFEIGMPTGT